MGLFNNLTALEPSEATGLQREGLARAGEAVPDTVLPVFGRSVFSGATTQFQPLTTGPEDPDYPLGPGDQVRLILTGDVELALPLDVTREGLASPRSAPPS